jgi:hypothetical protein
MANPHHLWPYDGNFGTPCLLGLMHFKFLPQILGKIDAAIDRGIAKMEVTDSGGRAIDVAPETKRAMADAVGELVKAETDLALLKVRDGGDEEMQAAETRRDQARTQVETLKADIEKQREAAGTQDGAVRTQVRDEIRDEVREAVRDVARN